MTEPSSQLQHDRVVRVFISSTFRDMKEERDYLVKFIFPQLRKLCEQRGVVWGEVDLRWGVTDEQKAEGQVLPICLEEIKRCRPYFIGILGARYGWVPDEIPQELIEKEEWLKEHLGHSVTELEILQGVLRNPDMAKHAFFYFRDPSYIESMPQEEKSNFTTEDTESAEKLEKLKNKIRKSGFPVHENYPDPKAFGEFVLQDLTKVINTLYPEGSQPDPLARDAADHEAFALSRARVYVGREEYFRRLDEHISSDNQPLVILGESGSGKSALIANWVTQYRERHPEDLLLMHFIGASPYSADWAAMLRRIMGEFKKRFDIQQDIPDKPDELRSAFANWLHMAAAKGRSILLLDALNQLEDRDGAPDLVWLPPVIPSNIRMILSTLPGRPLEELKKRNWETLKVGPFNQDERRVFIERYLAQYTKTLDDNRAELIASAGQTANPLYLQALLEELRVFGTHELLDKRISYYLEADTVPDLYGKILARYEEDYEQDRPKLVEEVMSCIWAARRGLTESELLDILGKDGSPLPRAIWSPLYLASEHSLINRSGLIGFSHDYFREAVRNKFLSAEEKQKAAHLRLSWYFRTIDNNVRMVDELPWQLACAKAWDELKDLLIQPDFFMFAWKANQFDVKAYWAQLEDNSYRKVDAYQFVLNKPEQANYNFVWIISMLLNDTGHSAEAFSLRAYLVKHFRQEGNLEDLQACLGNQAGIFYARGELDEAMRLYKEQERICRELGNKHGLSIAGQANVLYARGELDEAMRLYKEEERICRELGNKDRLQSSFGNQAVILKVRGELDEAMRLYKEQERICRELGNKYGLSVSLGNQANILGARGELDEAMKLHKEDERICRELGNKYGLSVSLGNQANILGARGELDEAMKLHKEAERLCRELSNKDGLQRSLGNQSNILADRGELDEAMRLLKEQEHICRELGNKNSLQISLGNQAVILHDRGELDEAMRFQKEVERICRELGNKDSLQISLGNQAVILHDRGELDEAMRLYKEQSRICMELRSPSGLAISLVNQSLVLSQKGQSKNALSLAEEAYRLVNENGLTALAERIKPILNKMRGKKED